MRKLHKLGWICGLLIVISGGVWGGFALAQQRQVAPLKPYSSYNSGDFFLPPYLSEQDRMGYGRAVGKQESLLNAGWYLDWGARSNPSHPSGAEYARLIYLNIHNTGGVSPCINPATTHAQVTPSLTGTALINAVNAAPGALWLVGNEPDSIYNGSPIKAELYAELYHYFYTTIKETDPTAKVVVGAIVQPSPVRMAYLDKVLNHYQATYQTPLLTDLWNIHFYILNEGPCGSWGAADPPLTSGASWNINFTASEMLDLETMRQNLVAFRQWMKDRGYQNKPLIITEFGVLPPNYFAGFEDDVAAQFLHDTFDLFRTATDNEVGYPDDNYRLLQMWAWFSTQSQQFGGNLFTNNYSELTIIGEAFVSQTLAHNTPYIDLQIEPPQDDMFIINEPADASLTGRIISGNGYVTNRGLLSAANVQARIDFIDAASQTVLQSNVVNIANLGPRYSQTPYFVSDSLNVTSPGVLTVTITIDPATLVADANTKNDQFSQRIVVSPDLAVVPTEDGPVIAGEVLSDTIVIHLPPLRNVGGWSSSDIPLRLRLQSPQATTILTQTIVISSLAVAEERSIITIWPSLVKGIYTIDIEILSENQPNLDFDPNNNTATYQALVPGYSINFPIIINQASQLRQKPLIFQPPQQGKVRY